MRDEGVGLKLKLNGCGGGWGGGRVELRVCRP